MAHINTRWQQNVERNKIKSCLTENTLPVYYKERFVNLSNPSAKYTYHQMQLSGT